jgi:hypothetical protein
MPVRARSLSVEILVDQRRESVRSVAVGQKISGVSSRRAA